MKKFQLLFLFLAFTFASNASVIEKIWYFNDYQIVESGNYQMIKFDGTMLTGLTGEPVLPYKEIKLLLPPGEAATNIEFIGEEEVIIPGKFLIYPQQPSRPLSDESPFNFTVNGQLYQTNAIYPEQQYGQLITSYLNGYAIALSSFTPVKYNPVTGVVSYYKIVKIRIHTASDIKSSKALKNLCSSTAVSERVHNFVQNPTMADQYPSKSKSSDDYQLLIVTPSQYQDNYQDLIDIYFERGMKTEIATTETINSTMTGQDAQEKIRNYIIQEYQEHSVEFVLLGGDVEYVPFRGFYCYAQSGSGYEDNDIPADLYYSGLDGNWNSDSDNHWGEPGEDDLLPDIAVARFPFSNGSELANLIHKSVSYQDSPVLGEFRNELFAGEWLYSGPDTWGSQYLELLIGEHSDNGYTTYGVPEDYNFQKLYEINQSWSKNDLIAAINQGKQFVQHAGHANQTYVAYLSNSDITNSNFSGANGITHNYTFLQTHGCDCGAFDYNDCILEKMVTIQNFAAAVIGNSRYGWFNEGQTEGPAIHLQREMVDAMFHEKLNQARGSLCRS